MSALRMRNVTSLARVLRQLAAVLSEQQFVYEWSLDLVSRQNIHTLSIVFFLSCITIFSTWFILCKLVRGMNHDSKLFFQKIVIAQFSVFVDIFFITIGHEWTLGYICLNMQFYMNYIIQVGSFRILLANDCKEYSFNDSFMCVFLHL